LGIGKYDKVRENGIGLDDSVWITMSAGALADRTGLPSLPVLDGNIKDVTPMKVHSRLLLLFSDGSD